MVLVDFHRDPSKMVHHDPEWALEHLRAGQEVFREEIRAAGFRVVEEPELPELLENYCMVFQKSGGEFSAASVAWT